jgi:hypothetical protein
MGAPHSSKQGGLPLRNGTELHSGWVTEVLE